MFSTMGGHGKVEGRSRDVFKRIANHGVPLEDYGTIKKIVTFDVPQMEALFRTTI